jgi:hypothetical protein
VTIKYNSQGNELWSRVYNGTANSDDWLNSLSIDNNGNTYVTGESPGIGSYNDFVTIKYDSEGDSLWVKRIDAGITSDDIAISSVIDNSGNIIVTGKAKYDFFTVKYNPQGDSIWSRRYSKTSAYGRPDAMSMDKEDNIFIYGGFYQTSTYKGQVVKYDSAGNLKWTFSHDSLFYGFGVFERRLTSIQSDDIGNVYLSSTFGENNMINNNYYDYRTIKLNSAGVKQWEKRFNSAFNDFDYATSMSLDKSGNVFVTGNSNLASGYNITTIKYNSSGNEIWNKSYFSGASLYSTVSSVLTDSLGNVYVNGETNSGMVLIKYSQPLSLDLTALIQGFYDSSTIRMKSDTVEVF